MKMTVLNTHDTSTDIRRKKTGKKINTHMKKNKSNGQNHEEDIITGTH